MTARGWWIGAGLALWAAAAPAGINPADPGLPTADAYGTSYAGNAVSALCIDCHTANPKVGGSHFVDHFDGTAVKATGNTAWQKLDAWPSGALSKYGSTAPPAPSAQSQTGLAGEVICESCHNLVTNAAGGNNLVEGYRDDADPSALCEGCHAAQAAGPPGHHPMTDDGVDTGSATIRYPAAAGSGVAYPGANQVACATCHAPHGAQAQTGARILRRGLSAVTGLPNVQGKPVNVIYYNDRPETGDVQGGVKDWCADHPGLGCARPGLLRQGDLSAFSATSAYRLVANPDPLCDACHVYND